MVTSIDSVRLTSAQIFMRVLKENAPNASGSDSGSLGNSLADFLTSDDSSGSQSDDAEIYNASLMQLLNGSGITGQTDESATTVGADDKVDTDAFMKALKAKLEDMKATADGKDKAEAMLAALKDGKLTITDAATGTKITAWDPEDATAKAAAEKTRQTVATQGWTEFLKANLARSRATYQHAENGAYIDTTGKNNAFFGTIGDKYAYISWPAATAATT